MDTTALTDNIEAKETGNSLYGEQVDDKNSQLVRWQEDLNPMLLELRADLRSEFYDIKSNTWKPMQKIVGYKEDSAGKLQPITQNLVPNISEEELQDIIGALRPIINHNTILGKHKEKKISKIAIRSADSFAFYISLLVGNGKISVAKADLIDTTITQMIYNTYNRGVDNAERNYAGKTQKQVMMLRQDLGDKKKMDGAMNG